MKEKPATDSQAWPVSLVERRKVLGLKMQAVRDTNGLSTLALARATRIAHPFIESLENGAFEKLPGKVFGRGFLRGICKQLGVDDEALLRDYDSCWEEQVSMPCLKVQIKNKPMPERSETLEVVLRQMRKLFTRRGLVGVGVPAAVLAGVLFATSTFSAWKPWLANAVSNSRSGAVSLNQGLSSSSRKTVTAKTETVEPEAEVAAPAESVAMEDLSKTVVEKAPVAAAPVVAALSVAPAPVVASAPVVSESAKVAAATTNVAPAAEAPSAAQTPPSAVKSAAVSQGGQRLDLVVTELVKVRFTLDGETTTKELAPSADAYRFDFADQADVMIYDAAALKITFNGRSLGTLGTKGRVRRLSFAADLPAEPVTKNP